MAAEFKAKINWDHSKENHGPWPRKTMVNLWFVHGTEMRMIETLRNVRTVLTDQNYKVKGEKVGASLELSSPKEAHGKSISDVLLSFV